MDRLTELKETVIVFGFMWFISLPVAVLCGTTIILIINDVIDRALPWQNFWDALSWIEALRVFLCGFFLIHGGFWGPKGLMADLRGEGILSYILSQRHRP